MSLSISQPPIVEGEEYNIILHITLSYIIIIFLNNILTIDNTEYSQYSNNSLHHF